MKKKPAREILKRLLILAGLLAALVFTIEGGEYGTRDLWSQKGRKARLDSEVAQLKLDVDSLRLELKSVRTDNARLERVARERYGMVRGDKELLFWVGGESGRLGDSASARPDSARSQNR